MLVLSRRQNEIVDFFFKNSANEVSTVSCAILDIDDHKVKIGFNANDKVKIMRREIEDGTPKTYFPVDQG